MRTIPTLILVLGSVGALVAFGYCIVIHVVNTVQPLISALEGIG